MFPPFYTSAATASATISRGPHAKRPPAGNSGVSVALTLQVGRVGCRRLSKVIVPSNAALQATAKGEPRLSAESLASGSGRCLLKHM